MLLPSPAPPVHRTCWSWSFLITLLADGVHVVAHPPSTGEHLAHTNTLHLVQPLIVRMRRPHLWCRPNRCPVRRKFTTQEPVVAILAEVDDARVGHIQQGPVLDRKSTRLNSSHANIS